MVRGRAHDTQTLTAFKYAHAHGACVSEQRVWKFVGNQGGRKCRTSFKEEKGSSNKAQGVEAESNYRHERPFSMRKAFQGGERNGTRDAKSVRPCARDAQTLTPRAGGRVRALRTRDASQRRRAAGAQDEKKWESERERWASDEWGCRAVATNRQNQG